MEMSARLLQLYRFSKNPRERGQLYIRIRNEIPSAQISPSNMVIEADDYIAFKYPEEIVQFLSDEAMLEVWFGEPSDEHRMALIPHLDVDTLFDEDVFDQLSNEVIREIVILRASDLEPHHLSNKMINNIVMRNIRTIYDSLRPAVRNVISRQISPTVYAQLPRDTRINMFRDRPSSLFLYDAFVNNPFQITNRELFLMNREDRTRLALRHDDPSLLLPDDMDDILMQQAIVGNRYNIINHIYSLVYPRISNMGAVPDELRRVAHIHSRNMGVEVPIEIQEMYNQYRECRRRYNSIYRSDEIYTNLITRQGTPVSNIPPEFLIEVEDGGFLYALDATEFSPGSTMINPFTRNPIPEHIQGEIREIQIASPDCVYRPELRERSIRVPEQMVGDWFRDEKISLNNTILSNILGRTINMKSEDDMYLVLAAYLYSHPNEIDRVSRILNTRI